VSDRAAGRHRRNPHPANRRHTGRSARASCERVQRADALNCAGHAQLSRTCAGGGCCERHAAAAAQAGWPGPAGPPTRACADGRRANSRGLHTRVHHGRQRALRAGDGSPSPATTWAPIAPSRVSAMVRRLLCLSA